MDWLYVYLSPSWTNKVLLVLNRRTFDCSRRLVAWVSDYCANRTRCAQLDDSDVLQGVTLPPSLLSPYRNELSSSFICHMSRHVENFGLSEALSSNEAWEPYNPVQIIQQPNVGKTCSISSCPLVHLNFRLSHRFCGILNASYYWQNLKWASDVSVCTKDF